MPLCRSRTARPLWLGLLTAVVGCSAPPTADLAGTVSYQDKPVRMGSVIVFDANGVLRTGNIGPDGSYTVQGVLTGPVQIAVQSPRPKRKDPPAKGRKAEVKAEAEADLAIPEPEVDPRGWVALPPRYSSPASSGLSTVLIPGPNEFEIKLIADKK